MPKRAWHCSRLHNNSTCLELLLPKWYSELKVVCTIIFKFYLLDLKVKHRSAFVIFTCTQGAARRRHVNARDRQDYFLLQGLKAFGIRQTCPKNFWKNLRISVERDPCRMPLALTLQRKNQKALHLVSASRRTNKMIWYKEHHFRILLRNNKRRRLVIWIVQSLLSS